jgi:methionine synthase II (cobalamin-independent)
MLRNFDLTTSTGNIQFDDPLLAYFCADSMIQGMEEQGVDHEALLNTYIKAYNDCLKGRPKDMTVGLHLCRGNFKVCTICPICPANGGLNISP